MKVLVSTRMTQGDRDGDYSWTVDGELVSPIGIVCANPKCGCARGFSGLASSRATTTAMVVDREHIGEAELRRAVTDSLERGGWFEWATPEGRTNMIEGTVEAIIDVTRSFSVGTVIRRDGDWISAHESLAA